MKTSMKKLLFLPIIMGILLFTSCQEESLELTQASQEEILVAKSNVSELIKQTVTNDGSIDNIIDRSNCFNIVLPVVVYVNGLEFIINTKEDFKKIESVFDEFEEDDDLLDIIFPITIVLKDYEEITIQNNTELQRYRENCNGENEEDDDIECVDFRYPIVFSIFNKDKNLLNTIRVHNDREMYNYIDRITENDVVGINFPISLTFLDGSVLTINNLSELEQTLKNSINSCDEDDDNDYSDDDFTLKQLNELLVMCPWVVNNVHRNNTNLSDNYRAYLIQFNEDGTVKVRARNGDIITGSWRSRVTDRGALLKLEFDSFVDFALEWFVYDIDRSRIKLFTQGGNHIILEKKCDIVFDHSKERIKNILQECFWRIARLRINSFDKESQYIGTPLKFNDDGTVKLRIRGELINGTWDILEANAGFVLQMNFNNRPDLNLYWLITQLNFNKLKLENQNSEMVIKRSCQDDNEEIRNINTVLKNGNWEVSLYLDNDSNKTENYAGFVIDFLESGAVLAEGNGQLIDGSWLAFRYDEMLRLALNFGLEPPFEELNNRWKIVDFNNNKMELIKFSDDQRIQKLILEKI
jgi:hypothetical protein